MARVSSGNVMVSMLVYDQLIHTLSCYQHSHICDDCVSGKKLTSAEWVEEHIRNWALSDMLEQVGITDHDCYHVLMVVEVEGRYIGMEQDYDEEIVIHEHSKQKMADPPEQPMYEGHDQ